MKYRKDKLTYIVSFVFLAYIAIHAYKAYGAPLFEKDVLIRSVEKEAYIGTVSPITTVQGEVKVFGKFKITAYCPCSECCGEWANGITYTGTVATEGRTIAVDPGVIPLGTKVEINGSEYIAEDVGGSIKGNRIDMFFNSHEEALKWGVREYVVKLVTE